MADQDARDRIRAAHLVEEARADDGGGKARQERQRKLGRLTARDRLGVLFDGGRFDELQRHLTHRGEGAERTPGDGVITALGEVDGRPVAAFAHDVTVRRGALGVDGASKVVRLYERALQLKIPVVGLHDSDGVRVDEGPSAIGGYGEIIRACIEASGAVPQIAVVCGLCVGAAAYSASLSDVVIMVDEWGFMFITGGKVTRAITGEDVAVEELGGARMHATVTGAAHVVAADDRAAIEKSRRILSFLPSHAFAEVPRTASDDNDCKTPQLWDLIPESRRKVYDVIPVIKALMDHGSLEPWSETYARNLWTGFARLAGQSIGVLASQPRHKGGALDVDAARKGARFVQLCSAFGLPLVTLADVPGFLPGKVQEQGGILLHGAQLLSAYGAADVPRVSVVLGKSYGGASVLSYTGDVVLALPTARYDVVGVDAAAEIVPHLEGLTPEQAAERRAKFLQERDRAHAAAEAGLVDRVVLPENLREELVRTLRALHGLERTHPRKRRLNTPT